MLFVSSLLLGRTITVDDDGPAEFRRIQDGINAARSGDVVSVAPGTYVESVSLSCLPDKVGVRIVGAGAEVTTVDGRGFPSVATLTNCDATTRLEGFTLRNGHQRFGAGLFILGGAPSITQNSITGNSNISEWYTSSAAYGGGMALQDSDALVWDNKIFNNRSDVGGGVAILGGSPIITRNLITGNSTVRSFAPPDSSGGGIALLHSDALVTDNSITGNSALFRGGGVALTGGSPTIRRNQITGNGSVVDGGGLAASLDAASAPTISENTFQWNSARSGGGLRLEGPGSAIVTNNVIIGNTALETAGIYGPYGYGGGAYIASSKTTLTNNTIADNTAAYGGGVATGVGEPNAPILLNNIISRNIAAGAGAGGGIQEFGAGTAVRYNIISLNSPSDCDTCLDPTNRFVDPLFVDPQGGDYRIGPGSPAIDSGTSGIAPRDDFRGERRPLDGDFDGVAGFDRGAFEYDRDAVLGLRFVTDALLNWDAIPGADYYHVYSGALATLLTRGLDTCRDIEDAALSDLAFTETRALEVGTGLAYVVTAVVGGVERSLGWNSLGFERPQAIHCP